jgi:hypothetical protein
VKTVFRVAVSNVLAAGLFHTFVVLLSGQGVTTTRMFQLFCRTSPPIVPGLLTTFCLAMVAGLMWPVDGESTRGRISATSCGRSDA